MKTRHPLAVLLASFLLPVQHLRAASDVTVSTAATSGGTFSGGNPNVFTPTANAAVANQTTIQTSLNAGTSATLTLNALRNLAINAAMQALTNTSTRAGRHYFHINAQATDIGAWETRLTVAAGEADLYLSQTAVPQTTASIPASRKSERTGSDGLVLRSDKFAAGQDWYHLVNATAGAQSSIFTGRAWVQDLGTLAWTDTNANSQYDIGEPALSSGSGNVNLAPEGIRFFRQIARVGGGDCDRSRHAD